MKNPKALYVHCSSHRLNLVVAKACTVPSVVQKLGVAQKITSFFIPLLNACNCWKKKRIMEIGLKQQKLIAPSTTHRVEQIASLDRIEEAFEAVYRSLQYMKSNDNRYFNSSTRDATYFK